MRCEFINLQQQSIGIFAFDTQAHQFGLVQVAESSAVDLSLFKEFYRGTSTETGTGTSVDTEKHRKA